MGDSYDRSAVNRREFLSTTLCGIGAAVASGVCLQATQGPSSPSNVRVEGGRRVVTAADFRYLGMFSVGTQPPGVRWGFSWSPMTGRRVGSELRLFLTGSSLSGDPLYEIAPPTALSMDVNAPTHARFIRNWGNIYSARPTGSNPSGNASWTRGILWDENMNGIWWAYGDQYNVAGWHDPSLGVGILDDVTGRVGSYGPWRTEAHSQRTRDYMVRIPHGFATQYCGGRRLGLGASVSSGNAASPWGPAIFAAGAPALTQAPDTLMTVQGQTVNGPTGSTPKWTVPCRPLVLNDMAHPLPRAANYKKCGWNVQYDCSRGSWIENGDPTFQTNDAISSAVWIDLADKYGVIFFGTMVWPTTKTPVPHTWYGPLAESGGGVCCHGQRNPHQEATGPGSGGQRAFWWIYDPMDMVRVVQGSAQPWGLNPKQLVQVYEQFAPSFNHWDHVPQQHITGAHFDSSSRRLYLAVRGGDRVTNRYEPCTMVYVFEVS